MRKRKEYMKVAEGAQRCVEMEADGNECVEREHIFLPLKKKIEQKAKERQKVRKKDRVRRRGGEGEIERVPE